ncbi:MAG: WhiB family transcriptional regulator [Actinomycetales bacterium]|nr:WhiB family transcriptional regulator [Actinomycetales bacterium]
MSDPYWRASALCAQVDQGVFFPSPGGPRSAAKDICARCPVRDTCGQFALDHDIRDGTWGGLSVGERRGVSTVAEAVAARDARAARAAVRKARAA